MSNCEDGLKRFDNLRADYKRRIVDCGGDGFQKERVAEWAVDSCERIVKETRD